MLTKEIKSIRATGAHPSFQERKTHKYQAAVNSKQIVFKRILFGS